MFENAGEVAGLVWNALNESAPLSAKDLKKTKNCILHWAGCFVKINWLLQARKKNPYSL